MSKNIFNSIKLNRPKRSNFDLTHDVKLTTDMGFLTPIMCSEVVPGDAVKINGQALIRFAPLVSPMMHRVDVSMHYFFVPNRILWPNWENWITGNLEVEAPYLTADHVTVGSLPDYLGVPTGDFSAHPLKVNALPFAAYQMIFNEYYRDQNLQESVNFGLVDGDNTTNGADLTFLRNRAWEHDYFTSSLPFAQKGAAVDIPLGQVVAPVKYNARATQVPQASVQFPVTPVGTTDQPLAFMDRQENVDLENLGLYAEGDVEPTTINDLRTAFKIQEWLERNARAGTRYIESILGHFGIRGDDARLNRPEYITGVKSPVQISEVLNTAGLVNAGPGDAGNVQGTMAGHGVNVTNGNRIGKYFCKEHGFVIGIMSVMPKTAYQQGLHRKFSKFDRFDYFWPEFAHLGEQEVKVKEVYAASANQEGVFGYVPRYGEYKFEASRVAGNFRDNLSYWHLGRIFSSEPHLNGEFVKCVPSKRVFAVTEVGTNSLYCQVLNRVIMSRLMPVYGNPGGL